MNYSLKDDLLLLVKKTKFERHLKDTFRSRIKEELLTRDENVKSHFCIYFAAYDPSLKQVFMGHHIKSGLWLFNGGHIDQYESVENALYREMIEEWGFIKKLDISTPSLFTLTQIENPKKIMCEWHYDIWYFIPSKKNCFDPDKKLIAQEFFEWGWKTIEEARSIVKNESTLKGLDYITAYLT